MAHPLQPWPHGRHAATEGASASNILLHAIEQEQQRATEAQRHFFAANQQALAAKQQAVAAKQRALAAQCEQHAAQQRMAGLKQVLMGLHPPQPVAEAAPRVRRGARRGRSGHRRRCRYRVDIGVDLSWSPSMWEALDRKVCHHVPAIPKWPTISVPVVEEQQPDAARPSAVMQGIRQAAHGPHDDVSPTAIQAAGMAGAAVERAGAQTAPFTQQQPMTRQVADPGLAQAAGASGLAAGASGVAAAAGQAPAIAAGAGSLGAYSDTPPMTGGLMGMLAMRTPMPAAAGTSGMGSSPGGITPTPHAPHRDRWLAHAGGAVVGAGSDAAYAGTSNVSMQTPMAMALPAALHLPTRQVPAGLVAAVGSPACRSQTPQPTRAQQMRARLAPEAGAVAVAGSSDADSGMPNVAGGSQMGMQTPVPTVLTAVHVAGAGGTPNEVNAPAAAAGADRPMGQVQGQHAAVAVQTQGAHAPPVAVTLRRVLPEMAGYFYAVRTASGRHGHGVFNGLGDPRAISAAKLVAASLRALARIASRIRPRQLLERIAPSAERGDDVSALWQQAAGFLHQQYGEHGLTAEEASMALHIMVPLVHTQPGAGQQNSAPAWANSPCLLVDAESEPDQGPMPAGEGQGQGAQEQGQQVGQGPQAHRGKRR